MIRRPPRSTLSSSSAASDVYKRQACTGAASPALCCCTPTCTRWALKTSSRRYNDLAVLTTATVGFALGVDTVEGTKHLRRADAGAAVGLGVAPQLATLRARLSALADGSDPLALQRAFAAGSA